MASVLALCWVVLVADPRQDAAPDVLKSALTAQDLEFWTKFSKAVENGDQRGMDELVRRQRSNAESTFLIGERLYSDGAGDSESQLLGSLDQLAKRLDTLDRCGRFKHRVEYNISLKNPKDRKDRMTGLDKMRQGMKLFAELGEDADTAKLKACRDLMEEARDVFDRVKDVENQAWTRYFVARLEQKAGNFLNAVVALDQAMDLWLQAEMAKGPEYLWMTETRRDLIEKGFDPEKGKGGAPGAGDTSGGGARNTSSSFAKDSAWKDVALKLRLDPKLEKVEKYSTLAFAGDDPYTWSEFTIVGNATGEFMPWFKPFGRTVYVVREGSSYFIDRDGDKKGDEKFSLNAKPSLVELYRNPADKRSGVYAVAIATGSQNETLFGLKISNVPGTDYAVVRYRSGCYLEGELEGQSVTILDDNDSGKFGDIVSFVDVLIDPDKPYLMSDAMVIGQAKDAVPYSEYFKLGSTFYRLKVADDNALKVRALDIDPGKVVMQWSGATRPDSLVIHGVGEFLGAAYDLAKAKDGVEVPPGTYQIAYGLLTNGKKSTGAQKVLILPGSSTPFEVQSGKTHTVEVGAPLRFDFTTRDENDQLIVVGKSVRIYGKSGECYAKFFDDVPRPSVAFKTESGTLLGKPEEMKLGDMDTWHKDKSLMYFPLDYSIKKRASDKVLAQLTLKKHKLLGGPITSDWK